MKLNYLVILFLSCFFTMISNSVCNAGIDLPWETTFDCPEWEFDTPKLDCDGLQTGGAWAACDKRSQITIDANMAAGGGGRGQRHWVGDGVNVNSGGVRVYFNNPPNEIWMRWYMRYEEGFEWSSINYDKILYMYLYPRSAGVELIPEWYGWDRWRNGLQGHTSGNIVSEEGSGWDSTMTSGALSNSHRVSDGKWHYFELHIKIDTNGSNGIHEMWIDDTKIISKFDCDLAGASDGVTGFAYITIGENQRNPSNGRCMAVDYDDIKISATGRIGPIDGSKTTETTVNITQPIGNETLSESVTISAEVQTTGTISNIQFLLDGQNIGGPISQSPYQMTLDTQGIEDGLHTISATATDTVGNQTTSMPISFTINNNEPIDEPSDTPVLLQEDFEDNNFSSRSWYDNTDLLLSTAEHIDGSTSSVEFHFLEGATMPTSGGTIRKKFTETDEVYVSYYVKYSSNWEGSNKSYHPHEFYLLTNLNSDWKGPASSHLTAYIEQNEGVPLLAIQDSENINEAQIGIDLTEVTENRAVAGCNGDSDGYGDGSCYSVGDAHRNGKYWRAGSVYFQDTPGTYYKNDWHHVEAYFKLNSISGGTSVANGQLNYWFDGNLIISHNDVILRTAQNENMKFNQFLIGPWIGDGSPVDQTMWVDDLTIKNGLPSDKLLPPSGLERIDD